MDIEINGFLGKLCFFNNFVTISKNDNLIIILATSDHDKDWVDVENFDNLKINIDEVAYIDNPKSLIFFACEALFWNLSKSQQSFFCIFG